MDDADSNDDTAEKQKCHLCSCRRAEINHLLEEIRRQKEELAQKRLDEDSFNDDDAKVKYYTGHLCFVLLMGVLTTSSPACHRLEENSHHFRCSFQHWCATGGEVVAVTSMWLKKVAFLINYYLGTWHWQIKDLTSETVLDSNVCRSENACIHIQPAGSKRCGGIAHLRGSCGEGDWMCTHKVRWLH